MIEKLFGTGTVTHQLRGGLQEASATHREIAERVAKGLGTSSVNGFGGELDAAMANSEQELTRNMAALADTQLRYEATARLLQKSYTDLRTAMRDRG
ncbi:MAG: hypothetical protein SFU57_12355 [Gemmatimonadales bacterium]|jgi:flagellar basal body rod protein FlgB|nr:hypothetical protein [Gemmatimonadales bacterium]MDZ4257278.1 hypothetical protein [Gemmatimonadales bacterium]MDZ4388967.1 hypothetical protein [Gemmatimonadales bacterium]